MASYEEKMMGQAGRYDPKVNSVRTEKTVGSETQDLDMKIHSPENSGPLNDNHMTRAVKQLNMETQRGEHAPTVGGHMHNPLMGR